LVLLLSLLAGILIVLGDALAGRAGAMTCSAGGLTQAPPRPYGTSGRFPGRRPVRIGTGRVARVGFLSNAGAARGVPMRELRCQDAGFDCDAVIQGDTDDEVFVQAGIHAKQEHGVEVTPELQEQLAPLLHDS
jgi:predicted small metal-binding protein